MLRKSIICALLLGWSSFGQAEQLVDKIVAVVNGSPILHSDVEAKVRTGFFSVSYFPAADDAPIYERALQDAINFQLIMQRAEELEIEVTDSELDQEINFNLERRGQNKEGLIEALKQAGMSYEDYREDFRKQVIFRRFQGMVIRPLIKITDKDLETYYLKKTGSTAENVRLVLRQILVRVPEGSVEEVVQGKLKLARSIYQKLESGTSFEEAAKIYSDLEGARQNGGLMPGVKLSDLSDSIRKEVEKLDAGKFTLPVRSPIGFHIFYLESKNFAGSDEFMKQKRELENELMMLEAESQTRRWLSEFRRKNEVKVFGDRP
jgi:peptidyl-prolyl cis-trans isomerase SurA